MDQSVEFKNRSEISVVRRGEWLVVDFPKPYLTLSWAVLGGGKKLARSVVWLRVNGRDLEPGVDASEYLRSRMPDDRKGEDVVGLLTSAELDAYADIRKEYGDYEVRSIATVGLSNAVRIGDPPTAFHGIGTINLLCVISRPLSYEAHLEALSLASEARTLAVIESQIESSLSHRPATGTGTDCIVVAVPEAEAGAAGEKYAGKHTVLGHLIGQAVYEAARDAISRWRRSNTP